MRVHFELPEFDAQLLRAIQQTYSGGADIGECLVTAKRIKEGDFDSWCDEWVQTADRIVEDAKLSETNEHFISASEAYLRASNYYRAATFFLYGSGEDPRFTHAFDRHVETFGKASHHFNHPADPILIPFEESFLPGYLYKVDNSGSPRPTVIVNNGYDGTHQEMYGTIVRGLINRGYNAVAFDGPGQGTALIKNGLHMRPDWHNVIAAVFDFITGKNAVDHNKIILMGCSWGGMLAPLAASKEKRLTALIVQPGQWDALTNIRRYFPDVADLLEKGDSQELTTAVAKILNNEVTALKFRSKMYIHGVDSAIELIKQWRDYTLVGLAEEISCPTLVLDTENEQLSGGQASKLYEALTCPKEFHLFTNKQGAGEHCSAGAIALFNQKAFDWLDTTISALKTKEELLEEVT